MTPCDSSLIKGYEFDENSWTLTIVFRSNNTARAYADCSPELFSEFESAKSKGSFYNTRIKGKLESMDLGKMGEEELAPIAEAVPLEEGTDEDPLGITTADIQAVDPGYQPVKAEESIVEILAKTEPKGEIVEPKPLSSDQAVAVLSPKNPKVDVLTSQLHQIAAVKFPVTDAPSQAKMEDHLVTLTQIRKAVFDLIDPYREIAYQAYTSVQKLNKARLDPADVAIAEGKQVLNAYLAIEQEKARQEQLRLQREAEAKAAVDQQRRTEELRLQVASEAQERGDANAESLLFDTEIQAPPVQTYVPRVEMPKSNLGGRKNWKARIINIEDLILDVAEGIKLMREKNTMGGHAPANSLEANLTVLNQLAKANEKMLRIPGVESFNDAVLVTTKSGRK